MFNCLATHTHRLGVLIKTLLHGFEYVFVLPSCDPAFRTCRAARFEGTARTCCRPIATQCLAVLLVRVPVGQLLTRRAAVPSNVNPDRLAKSADQAKPASP